MGERVVSETTTKWSVPQQVTGLDVAFPANVVGRLLPEWDAIPKEFRRGWHHGNPWCDAACAWFFGGVDTGKSTIEFAPHLSKEQQGFAWGHLQACLGSWEPKHEHKLAGVGWLLSQWFAKFVVVPRKKP